MRKRLRQKREHFGVCVDLSVEAVDGQGVDVGCVDRCGDRSVRRVRNQPLVLFPLADTDVKRRARVEGKFVVEEADTSVERVVARRRTDATYRGTSDRTSSWCGVCARIRRVGEPEGIIEAITQQRVTEIVNVNGAAHQCCPELHLARRADITGHVVDRLRSLYTVTETERRSGSPRSRTALDKIRDVS